MAVIDLRDQGRRERAINQGMQNVFRGLSMMESQKARERALARQQKQDELQLLSTASALGTTPDKLLTPEGQVEALTAFQERKQQEKAAEAGRKERKLVIEEKKAEQDILKSSLDQQFKQSQIDLNKSKTLGQKKFPNIKDNQWEAATYAKRMEDSEKTIDELSGRGFDFGSIRTALVTDDSGNVSFVAKKIRNPDERKYVSAAWNWITAKLRKESGAAISAEEFANDFKIFFPSLGSTSEDVAFKKRQRDIPLVGFRASAGETALNEVGRLLAERRSKRESRLPPITRTAAKPVSPTEKVLDTVVPEARADAGVPAIDRDLTQRFRSHPLARQAYEDAMKNPFDPKSQQVFIRLGIQPGQ